LFAGGGGAISKKPFCYSGADPNVKEKVEKRQPNWLTVDLFFFLWMEVDQGNGPLGKKYLPEKKPNENTQKSLDNCMYLFFFLCVVVYSEVNNKLKTNTEKFNLTKNREVEERDGWREQQMTNARPEKPREKENFKKKITENSFE
jgi:hypothetical protein